MPETVLVNGNAYSLLKLLGKGKGGYSYLAQMADGQQVVVKQIHHEPCVYYQFGNKIEAELRDYNHLQEIGIPMPRMLDVDTKAERIVKEYIAGETGVYPCAERCPARNLPPPGAGHVPPAVPGAHQH